MAVDLIVTVLEGNHESLSITVTDDAGTARDITNDALAFYVKDSASADDDAATTIKLDTTNGGITKTDAPNGLAQINGTPDDITAAHSAARFCKLNLTKSNGDVKTLAPDDDGKGLFIVKNL